MQAYLIFNKKKTEMKHTKASSFMDFMKKIGKLTHSIHKPTKSIIGNNPTYIKTKAQPTSAQAPIPQPYSNSNTTQSAFKSNGISYIK